MQNSQDQVQEPEQSNEKKASVQEEVAPETNNQEQAEGATEKVAAVGEVWTFDSMAQIVAFQCNVNGL